MKSGYNRQKARPSYVKTTDGQAPPALPPLLKFRKDKEATEGCVNFMNGQNRKDIKIGSRVEVVLKADQKTGILTYGIVAEILTNSSFHPHGIKVRLKDGQVGRVKNISSPTS